jgi:hypothetical protein
VKGGRGGGRSAAPRPLSLARASHLLPPTQIENQHKGVAAEEAAAAEAQARAQASTAALSAEDEAIFAACTYTSPDFFRRAWLRYASGKDTDAVLALPLASGGLAAGGGKVGAGRVGGIRVVVAAAAAAAAAAATTPSEATTGATTMATDDGAPGAAAAPAAVAAEGPTGGLGLRPAGLPPRRSSAGAGGRGGGGGGAGGGGGGRTPRGRGQQQPAPAPRRLGQREQRPRAVPPDALAALGPRCVWSEKDGGSFWCVCACVCRERERGPRPVHSETPHSKLSPTPILTSTRPRSR